MSEKIEKKLLHYMTKAAREFKMIDKGNRVLVCLSGGKDSFTLLTLLNKMRIASNNRFEIFAFTLDQAQPGWQDQSLRDWLEARSIAYEILHRDTYSIVKEKVPAGKTYCSLCSRLRRGIIYRYAEEHGFDRIALGHHRDDLIETFLMSALYNGRIQSMPPKLLSDNQRHVVIRPMVYCQEADIIAYAKAQEFPIIPCNLCGSQENLMRQRIKVLLRQLATENPKVPSNLLHALQSISPSQLMDQSLWDFKSLNNAKKRRAYRLMAKP